MGMNLVSPTSNQHIANNNFETPDRKDIPTRESISSKYTRRGSESRSKLRAEVKNNPAYILASPQPVHN